MSWPTKEPRDLKNYLDGESDLALVRIALDYYNERGKATDPFFLLKVEMDDQKDVTVRLYQDQTLVRAFKVYVKPI